MNTNLILPENLDTMEKNEIKTYSQDCWCNSLFIKIFVVICFIIIVIVLTNILLFTKK
jgi:hypothetical protein